MQLAKVTMCRVEPIWLATAYIRIRIFVQEHLILTIDHAFLMPLNEAPTICFLAILTTSNIIFFKSSAELPSILTIIPCLAGRIDVPPDILPLTSNPFIFSLISYWRSFT